MRLRKVLSLNSRETMARLVFVIVYRSPEQQDESNSVWCTLAAAAFLSAVRFMAVSARAVAAILGANGSLRSIKHFTSLSAACFDQKSTAEMGRAEC